MEELIKLFIGAIFLVLGIPIGNFLAYLTKEELKSRQKYFKIIIWISLVGGFFELTLGSDVLMFSFFFIAIVTSRSLK